MSFRVLRRRYLWLLLLLLPLAGLLLNSRVPDRYDRLMAAAQRAFVDGYYRQAQADFRQAGSLRADDRAPRIGEALALLQLEEFAEAETLLDGLVDSGAEGERAYVLANRGILYDRTGRHAAALVDYDAALALNPELAAGPGFVTRFLRNQAEKPPTIADRARYLRRELAKPPGERLLVLPVVDAEQRPYTP